MEEPEIHLHPVLQRRLLRYLERETDNQYFIATHSAHLMDACDASIFHIRMTDGVSTVSRATGPDERFSICSDLGYHASDLLQSNCVVWVEGPSDRIYLRHWLHAKAPDLIEGIDYTIMFYGGAALMHLSADSAEVTEFISLRRLNRNLAVLMDSDLDKGGADLREVVVRIQNEVAQGGGLVWVTAGRTIENYIDPDVRIQAIRHVYPHAKHLCNTGQFAQPLRFVGGRDQENNKPQKVAIAHEVALMEADLSVLDLHDRIGELEQFIRASNPHRAERNVNF
jgi:hypothetical protein